MNKTYLKSDGPHKHLESIYKNIKYIDENYPKTIKDKILFDIGLHLENSLQLVDECESPIEFLLASEITSNLDAFNGGAKFHYYLHSQWNITTDENRYRADFLLAPIMLEGDTYYPNVIIECDGHEFHEKTKNQAANDKARDRALQYLGYKVIRFTGSEIVKNPRKCASEIFGFVKQIEKQYGFGDQDG